MSRSRTKRVKVEEPVSIKLEQLDSSINQSFDQHIDDPADQVGHHTKSPLSVTWVYQKSDLQEDQSNHQTDRPVNFLFQHSLTENVNQDNNQTAYRPNNQNLFNHSTSQSAYQSTTKTIEDLPLLFHLPVPSDCSLASIVCSYGFFRLPPNTWIAPSSQFQSITQTIKQSDTSSYQVINLSIYGLGPVPNGCLIRALRFGESLSDAVYVIITEESINQTNNQIFDHLVDDLSERIVKSESESSDRHNRENNQYIDSDDILTYKTDSVICVRALFPPHNTSFSEYSESIQSVNFVFDSAALYQLESQVCRMLRLEPHCSVNPMPRPISRSDIGSIDSLPPSALQSSTISSASSISDSSSQPHRQSKNPYAGFYRLCPAARERGFARLFRSPLLFEDAIKSVTLCNVNWTGTIAMNRFLCQRVGVGQSMSLNLKVVVPDMSIQSTRQSNNQASESSVNQSNNASDSDISDAQAHDQRSGYLVTDITLGVFPSPLELSLVDDESLRSSCRVGYRSGRLIGLANMCVDGSLDREIDQRMTNNQTTSEIRKFIQTINGFGPFASNNLMALIGRFDAHAFDSETIRHMREHHLVDQKFELTSAQLMKHAQQHYSFEKYGQFMFLVYWFELWCGYEKRVNTVAHKWTDRQFASFSGGGPKPAIDPSTNQSTPMSAKGKPLQHWQLVAQQTRKRKKAGLTSSSQPRKRSTKSSQKQSSNQSIKGTNKRLKSTSRDESDTSFENVYIANQSIDNLVAPPPSTDAMEMDHTNGQSVEQSFNQLIEPPSGPMTRSQSRALHENTKADVTKRQTNRKLTVPEMC